MVADDGSRTQPCRDGRRIAVSASRWANARKKNGKRQQDTQPPLRVRKESGASEFASCQSVERSLRLERQMPSDLLPIVLYCSVGLAVISIAAAAWTLIRR